MNRLVLGLISGLCVCAVVTASYGQIGAVEPSGESVPVLLKSDALSFQPAMPETGDKLSLKIKKSDNVSSAEVTWSINGEYVETSQYDGIAESVPLQAKIKGGDMIEVAVKPFHPSGVAGQPVTRKVTCRKPAPTLKLTDQRIEGNLYTAKVVATDPEGGPLTLSVAGPPGMAIDPKGTITWKMTETTSGNFNVKVTAKDEAGSQAELTYSFRVTRR
jgi:hypothetical protein